MIKTILFDLGGVIYTGDVDRAMSRFRDIGLQDVEKRLNAYTQTGIFGKLEDGSMSDTDFLG
ncbi:MAG: HAD family phosphatase, partial [Prevotella micans]|nr:HAD family phosphatase [Prevotella micans]